jgi:hypothetical protein
MSIEQIRAAALAAAQEAYKQGQKDGIRLAVESCMGAYTIVLESNGMMPFALRRIFQEANDEVFRLLAEKQLDLSDIPQFAARCMKEEE